jgi:hypothetical protein
MRQKTSNRAVRRGLVAIAAAALTGATVLFGAAPARANNEFKNGFEDQLGRIAAVGAVNFGLSVLSGGYYPAYPVAPAVVPVPVAPVVVHPVYYGPAYYQPVYRPVYYAPRPVVVYGKPYKYKHGRGHGHGW